jgi:hypothetical protein
MAREAASTLCDGLSLSMIFDGAPAPLRGEFEFPGRSERPSAAPDSARPCATALTGCSDDDTHARKRDSDEEPPKKRPARAAPKRAAAAKKLTKDDSSDDDDEEEKPKKAAPKGAAKRVKKEECGRASDAARNGAGRKREKLSLDDGTSVRACLLR